MQKKLCTTKVDIKCVSTKLEGTWRGEIKVPIYDEGEDNDDDDDDDDISDEGDEDDNDDDASVWSQKWGSQLPSEVSAERMSGFRET